MKLLLSIFCLSIVLVGCQPKPDTSFKEKFNKNSKTVLAALEGFQQENLDYSMYADDFVALGTGFGSPDSLSLNQMKENDKWLWETLDFEIVTDSLQMLPGVDPDTKEFDGSVRYYADWKVTLPGTDSTAEKSGVLKMYESYDFDEEGKIRYQQSYGDFTGIMDYLLGKKEEGMEEATAEAPQE